MSWIWVYLFLLALCFAVGVFTAYFTGSVLKGWIGILSKAGLYLARRLKSNPDLWVPKYPSPRTWLIEIWVLRITGIVLAAVAIFSAYVVFVR